jgi:hypothetical protein
MIKCCKITPLDRYRISVVPSQEANMMKFSLIAVLLLSIFISIGCSGGSSSHSPLLPGLTGGAQSTLNATSKAMWGVWEVDIDTSTWGVTAIPLRGTQYTVDVVTFLQKPSGNPTNLAFTVKNVTQWLTDGLIEVDVGLKHPFPGLDQFTGFDVLGVFVTPGSTQGNYDSDVIYTNGVDEPILRNPDGYTRWMNPVEFPANGTILRFVPGKAGTPDLAPFTSTINAYKYFADGLDSSQSVSDFFAQPPNVANRGLFRPGSFNHRDYQLKFPMVTGLPKLIFQYAVIASWVEPDKTLSGAPDVLDVPGDFPFSANANEAILMSVVSNDSTLFFNDGIGGGNIKLGLEVFDWGAFQSSTNVSGQVYQIVVEGDSSVIPGGHVAFDNTSLKTNASPGSSGISSVFQVEIAGCTPSNNNNLPILITIENTSPDKFDPGTGTPGNDDRLAGYFRIELPVSGEVTSDFLVTSPNGGETLWMALYHNITWDPGTTGIANVKIEWSTDDFVSDIRTIIASTPNTGSFIWKPIPNVATTTAKVRVSDVLGIASDESDNDFTIGAPVWLDFQNEVEIDNSTVTWNYCWLNYEKSFDEISPALSQDIGGMVHMCWHGQTATNPPPSGPWMAHDVTIRSTDGSSWNGEGDCLHTEGGAYPGPPVRTDNLKLAASSVDATFSSVRLFNIYFSPEVDAWMHMNFEYNYNLLAPSIENNCEIMADDAYLYLIGDSPGPGIYCQRVPTPNWIWDTTSVVTYTNSGEVSHVRSWAIQGGRLGLAYYTTAGQIKLLRQIDQPNDIWDDTEVIFDGSGYTGCKDPSIAVDGDGRQFAIWTGVNSTSNNYEILASMKPTLTDTWSTPMVAASSDVPFNDASLTLSSEKVLLPTGDSEYMVLIGYENGGAIYSIISPKDLWAFLPVQSVSSGTVPEREPDVLCLKAPYTFDALFTWSFEVTPGDPGIGNHDIKFRNGDFKTP